MKRFFITFITALTLISCEGLLEEPITQQDVIGTWNFYTLEGNRYGKITIDQYGDCSLTYHGFGQYKYEENEYEYVSRTFNVSGNKVTIDIPSWKSGTFKIITSRKQSNRFLINPDIKGNTIYMADALIQKEEVNATLFMIGSANW